MYNGENGSESPSDPPRNDVVRAAARAVKRFQRDHGGEAALLILNSDARLARELAEGLFGVPPGGVAPGALVAPLDVLREAQP